MLTFEYFVVVELDGHLQVQACELAQMAPEGEQGMNKRGNITTDKGTNNVRKRTTELQKWEIQTTKHNSSPGH